jgi:ankyrin repeat protein
MAALKQKHSEVAQILIRQGAEVNAAEINGATPLFITAALNYQGIVKTLIEKGADVNAKDNFGMDPLFLAPDKGHLEVAKILFENNPDLYNLDAGRTALEAARYRGSPYIVDLIQEARKKQQENSEE